MISERNCTVSVVIPTHNRADRVGRAIRSVLEQTYQDFEVLVVDDCSTDDTSDVVRGFSDPRVRYIRHDQNRGPGAARNTGIRASSGEYIAFLDSDDEWLPQKLEKQIDLFRRSPERVGLAYTGAFYVYREHPQRLVSPAHRGGIYRDLLRHNVVGGASVGMIRRAVLARVGEFDEQLPTGEDRDLWLRIAEHFDVDFVAVPLVRVYKDGSGISRDAANNSKGFELFYWKHRAAMEEERVAHLYLRGLAQLYHRPSLANMSKARQYYRASIRARPGSLLSYLLLLAAYLPSSLYKVVTACTRSSRALVWRLRRAQIRGAP